MSVTTELRSPDKPASATRTILGPAGNRVRSLEQESKQKTESALKKTPEKPRRSNSDTPAGAIAVRSKNNVNIPSANNSFSSDSSGGVTVVSSSPSSSDKKIKNIGRRVKGNDDSRSTVEASPEDAKLSSLVTVPLKRCDWITQYSDPLYSSFHDGEWGVPVHDDRKLFELFVLSIALAELTWPAILYKRDAFRKHFDNFDPSSVAKFSDQKSLSVRANCSTLLSEPKLRAVIENANQLLKEDYMWLAMLYGLGWSVRLNKVQQEFGSFSNYCWKFVNHKPIRNGFRYARQVPAKTPKSELISKDLMRRGFRCVGPTVIYSFMQVSGMVNDHLITCFRYHECNNNIEEKKAPAAEALEITSRYA